MDFDFGVMGIGRVLKGSGCEGSWIEELSSGSIVVEGTLREGPILMGRDK